MRRRIIFLSIVSLLAFPMVQGCGDDDTSSGEGEG